LESLFRKARIAIITSDTRLASRILSEAASRGVEAMHVMSETDLPLSAKVIITKRLEFPEPSYGHTVFAEDYTSPTAIIDRAIEVCAGKAEARQITVSLDPGKRVGAAYLVDDVVVRTATYTDYEMLASSIEEFVKNHPNVSLSVVIGAGAPNHRDEMLRFLKKRLPFLSNASIHLVPEDRTSRQRSWMRSRRGMDESAAASLQRRLRRVKLS